MAFHTSCILAVPMSFLMTPDRSQSAYSRLIIAIPIIPQGATVSKVPNPVPLIIGLHSVFPQLT